VATGLPSISKPETLSIGRHGSARADRHSFEVLTTRRPSGSFAVAEFLQIPACRLWSRKILDRTNGAQIGVAGPITEISSARIMCSGSLKPATALPFGRKMEVSKPRMS
jgi:hypothetical protein